MELSDFQLERLSVISSDIGQVFFAALFIGPLATGEIDFPKLIGGFLMALIFWATSVFLIQRL